MASAFGHILASAALSGSLARQKLPKKFWILTLVAAVLPDLDVLAFKFGTPYQHPLGHRGFTHSIVFAIGWSGIVTFIFFKKRALRSQVFFLLFISILSHGFLDALTNGGLGVGFFIPFNNSRYFFPFHPIEVSPIKIGRFFDQAPRILVSEAIWIGIPCSILFLISAFINARRINS